MTDKNDSKKNDNPTEIENAAAGLTSKRLRFAEPDLHIKVGETIFKEYSGYICQWSEFIDAALASGMTEKTQSGEPIIELPGEPELPGGPQEWERIRSLMAPRSSEKITAETIDVVLSWFSYLESKQGLSACDDSARNDVLAASISPFDWDSFTAKFQRSIRYNLPESKMACATVLSNFLKTVNSQSGPSDPKRIEEIICCMQNDADVRDALWPTLKTLVPTYFPEIPVEELVRNDLLFLIIFEGIQKCPPPPPKWRCRCGENNSNAVRTCTRCYEPKDRPYYTY